MNLVRKLIFFLLFYIPLEEFILKWLPVSVDVYNYFLFLSDGIILVIIFIYITKKRFVLPWKTENIYFFLFIFFSFFSLLYYESWSPYLFKIWVLCRYILVFFIVRAVFRLEDFFKFQHYFILIFFIQLIVGLVQITNFPFLYDLFLPRSDLSKGANWLLKEETGMAGTFSYTVHYGFFMYVFCFFISLSNLKRNKKILLMFLALVLSLFSDSRIAFILTFFIFIFYFYLSYKTLLLYFVLGFFILPVIFFSEYLIDKITPLLAILDLFSYEFINRSIMFSRVGILKLIPLFFNNDLFTILFGFSLDGTVLTTFINQSMGSEIPHVLSNNAVIGIEDVYWVAHLYYFGLFGVVFYLMIFMHLKRSFKRINGNYINLKMINFFISLTLISAFVNQVFSFKPFVFYFFFVIAFLLKKLKTNDKNINLNKSSF